MIAPAGSGGAPRPRTGRRRVVVAMSGGVDSSVAAALLAREGHEVVGVTMRNFCYAGLPETGGAAGCCSLEAIEDARRVADRVGFPHYVLDFEGPFGRAVIDDFVAEYAAGRTPNPCVRCNRLVRFPHLHARARALGADAVATGHYARADRVAGGVRLLRGSDRAKDQSYYLWGLTPRLLDRTLFPVGHLAKPAVRALAAELGLEVAQKPESMEVCFVPEGDVRGFLLREAEARRLAPEARARFEPGPVVSTAGRLLGRHAGSAFFTVGQRRGLGVAAGEPRYVIELRAPNTVVLGAREELAAGGCVLAEVNWVRGAPPARSFEAEVQVRHRSRPTRCLASLREGGAVVLELFDPVSAVAPGQSAVLYRGEEVLGGGVIARARRGDAGPPPAARACGAVAAAGASGAACAAEAFAAGAAPAPGGRDPIP